MEENTNTEENQGLTPDNQKNENDNKFEGSNIKPQEITPPEPFSVPTADSLTENMMSKEIPAVPNQSFQFESFLVLLQSELLCI